MQDAFTSPSSAGRATGTPPNPGAWIMTTARNRAIDRLRREQASPGKAERLARPSRCRPRTDPTMEGPGPTTGCG